MTHPGYDRDERVCVCARGAELFNVHSIYIFVLVVSIVYQLDKTQKNHWSTLSPALKLSIN